MNFKCILLSRSNCFIDFESGITSVKLFSTFNVFNTFILVANVRPIRCLKTVFSLCQHLPFLVWRCSAETNQELYGFSPCTGEPCQLYACFNHYYLANTICDWFHAVLIKHSSPILHENQNNHLTFLCFQPEVLHLLKNLHAIIMITASAIIHQISLTCVLFRTILLQIGLSLN